MFIDLIIVFIKSKRVVDGIGLVCLPFCLHLIVYIFRLWRQDVPRGFTLMLNTNWREMWFTFFLRNIIIRSFFSITTLLHHTLIGKYASLTVVSIGLFLSQIVRFCKMEYVKLYLSFLLVMLYLFKKVPMEMKSYISLGRTIEEHGYVNLCVGYKGLKC